MISDLFNECAVSCSIPPGWCGFIDSIFLSLILVTVAGLIYQLVYFFKRLKASGKNEQ